MKRTVCILSLLMLMGCSENGALFRSFTKYEVLDEKVSYIIGYPYKINGIDYVPQEDFSYMATGIAGWYNSSADYMVSSNGEVHDKKVLTAMHKTLPLPSLVKITNIENGKIATVRINERGPYDNNRLMDVSKETAKALDFNEIGTTKIKVEILKNESLQLKADILGLKNESNTAAPAPNIPEKAPTYITKRIQIGAFAKQKSIDLIKEKLSPDFEIITVPVLINYKTLYKVQIAPFKNEQDIINALDKVHQSGYHDAIIIN